MGSAKTMLVSFCFAFGLTACGITPDVASTPDDTIDERQSEQAVATPAEAVPNTLAAMSDEDLSASYKTIMIRLAAEAGMVWSDETATCFTDKLFADLTEADKQRLRELNETDPGALKADTLDEVDAISQRVGLEESDVWQCMTEDDFVASLEDYAPGKETEIRCLLEETESVAATISVVEEQLAQGNYSGNCM